MSKHAFTMIELIFVIVIIGILAAIAIPKLVATRDDAKISAMMQLVAAGVGEVGDYVLSQGKADTDFTVMSNVFKRLAATGQATSTSRKLSIKFGNVTDCVTVQMVANGGDEDIEVQKGSAGADVLCKRLHDSLDLSKYTIALTGARVVY